MLLSTVEWADQVADTGFDPDRWNAVFRAPGRAERLKHTIECLDIGSQSTGGI